MEQNNQASQPVPPQSAPAPQPTFQPGQPMPQPPRPPKQPMDPAKKKKIIMISAISGAVVLLIVLAVILIPTFFRVDYSTAYKSAKDLSPKIYEIYSDNSCNNVVDYANSTSITDEEYSDYIEGCKGEFSGVGGDVTTLGETAAVKKDSSINEAYSQFKNEYDKLAGTSDSLGEALEVYRVWHNYVLAVSKLNRRKSTETEIRSVANILIDSGISAFKTYGEGWAEKTMAMFKAYREYWSDLLNKTFEEKNKEAENALSDYINENKPVVSDIAGIKPDDKSKMYLAWKNLYDSIREKYQENYDNSGMCTEFLGEVYCD